jgi:DnaJ family protein C protein 28
VKKIHPDSGCPEAGSEKFLEVDEAFRILQKKYAKSRRNIDENPDEEVKIYDIKHTAPQHRQYLTYGGFGSGTPAQREKQYQQRRAMKAQENVLEHRLQKAQASDNSLIKKGDHFKKHAIKTHYGFDRVVEDLIQEAMSKGDFNNLTGAGKPLDNVQSQNPYVDFVTHKMNKILLDNGFVPEWITLQKEIRESIRDLKNSLYCERAKLGPVPLDDKDSIIWNKKLKTFENTEMQINKNIDKYNLIVPILGKQMVQIRLRTIADKILKENITDRDCRANDKVDQQAQTLDDHKPNLFTFLGSFFHS